LLGWRQELRRSMAAGVEPIEIATGVWWLQVGGVNVYFVHSQGSWTLVDAGWARTIETVRRAAEWLFADDAPPAAILLTHAHPEHVGAAAQLANDWNVPAYVHRDDIPLLSGDVFTQLESPQAITRAILRVLRRLPRRVRERLTNPELAEAVKPLPARPAEVPGLPEWEWVPVPGHTPGQVAYFRRADRTALVGDALMTVPLAGLLPRLQRISPPVRLASWDWQRVKRSVCVLASLEPRVLAAGHGIPMSGALVAGNLREFAARLVGVADAGETPV
jgi:glyoxylase-like metal-dependent hydrolase (beta-lactamase superfamily II)